MTVGPPCPACGQPMACFCPVCRGKLGGQAKSARKTIAVRRNARKPRPRAKPPP